MEEQYKNFSANLYNFMSDLHRYIPSDGTKKFLDVFNKFDTLKLVERYHTAMATHKDKIAAKNESMFANQLNLFPEVDLSSSWSKLSSGQKNKLWTYMQILFIQSELILTVMKKEKNNKVDKIEKIEKIEKVVENNNNNNSNEIVPVTQVEKFNPYVGVGDDNVDYSINEMLENLKSLPQDQQPMGMTDLLKLVGINKLINMDELTDQLKNMSKDDIDQATNVVKSMLGNNVDDQTAGVISEMLTNIGEELQKNDLSKDDPFSSLTKIAEIVSNKLKPKIEQENIDLSKVWNSTENMSNNLKDQNGNPLFGQGGMNPFSLLNGMLSGKMSDKQVLNDCNNMLQSMGIDPNKIDPTMLQQMQQSKPQQSQSQPLQTKRGPGPQKKYRKR